MNTDNNSSTKENLTKIKFHGKFGKFLGNRIFKAKVSSLKDAMRAVDCLSGRKFTKFFLEDKNNLTGDYRVLVNGKEIAAADKRIDDLEKLKNSEFLIKNNNIETIDVIPVIKGSDDFMSVFIIIVGILLVVFAPYLAGALVGAFGLGGGTAAGVAAATATLTNSIIIAGLGLVAAGVMNLLAEPPKFQDFQDPSAKKSFGQSYLFDGPKNTAGEGTPIPFGYGRMLIGGHSITASYDLIYKDARASIAGAA